MTNYSALYRAMGAKPELAAALATASPSAFARVGITTKLRLAHFMAQAAHETGGFRWLREIWGPTPAQRRYEGRRDLGNVYPGDGKRFMGRGIFQLTGRANYAAYGMRIGVDLVSDPDRAAEPDLSLRIACEYWRRKGLNILADADNARAITKLINGGFNGFDDRIVKLQAAKGLLA
jgi:putative chitinase